MGAFDEAVALMTLETLRLILLLVKEHYELTGTWITPPQLRDALKHPR